MRDETLLIKYVAYTYTCSVNVNSWLLYAYIYEAQKIDSSELWR